MGSLRDQFKKAKILSEKDSKRLAHDERVERKTKGRDRLESERAAREAELARIREEARLTDRARQEELDAARRLDEESSACEALLEIEARAPSRGPVSWMFELEDGRLPMLRLADAERHQLVGGHLCIVRTRPGDAHVYALLATPHARRVAKALPGRVVWAAPGALAG